ncbi:MAG: TAT-variant-translocated molybdopterin oxidoreductase [Planctomycetota bacterium]
MISPAGKKTASCGARYWRSLGELQDTPEFREFLHREFPVAASEFPKGLPRRRWMQLMGASLAFGGLAGCRWQPEKIAPFAVRPENRVPGQAEKFATSIDVAGMPRHLLVTSYDGRPVKVEGNPDHPDSQGATDTFAQASILELYDPDRSDTLRERQPRQTFTRSWDEFDAFWNDRLTQLAAVKGLGLGLLIEPVASFSQAALLRKLRDRFPQVEVFEHTALAWPTEIEATQITFGQPYRTSLQLQAAKRIACFDADILGIHPTSVRNIRGFADGRTPGDQMNRLFVAESQFSVTGAAADHRLAVRSHDLPSLLGHVEALVSEKLGQSAYARRNPALSETAQRFAEALASDLVAHRGESLVVVGPQQPLAAQELALRLNARLQNIGQTIRFVPQRPSGHKALSDLVQAAADGRLQTLMILGGNPVYDAPRDLDLPRALADIEMTVRAGVYEDETSAACRWHVPLAHPFEAWDDVRSWDDGVAVAQPLIDPLLGGRSPIQLLAQVADDAREPQRIVQDALGKRLGRPLSTTEWQDLVHDGLWSSPGRRPPSPQPVARFEFKPATPPAGLELVFTPSGNTLDGRFSNNGWLQETPDFLTKLTWDNAAIISPQTAVELGLEHGQFARLETESGQLEVPVYVLPGQAKHSIGLAVGYGRTRAGVVGGHAERAADSIGVDVHPLRTSRHPFVTPVQRVTPLPRTYAFATTQDHHAIDTVGMEETGRRVGELVREAPLDQFLQHPDFAQHATHHVGSDPLWKGHSYEGHAWGMAIDLNKCIGCNACTVACQAENNVPIVGKDQVAVGREMHWLRIDRYFHGDSESPEVAHQPVACHHCENAPCEQVCPVAATVHSDEGLNDMVYNRCIGTRYCGNNCPYKVRRFNFLDYNEPLDEPGRELVQLSVNPEVTVRSRGVMEKCTYCVQRIQTVKIDAKTGRRTIEDGEVKTACQQACPAQAIEFGDLNDPKSRVAQLHADQRAYGMLAELAVKPRTKYLARIRNPHPLLAESTTKAMEKEHEHGHG